MFRCFDISKLRYFEASELFFVFKVKIVKEVTFE